ncbi:MAG: N-acetylmuramoyl-L-alanine amidase [bacterium]|nr:N-acetylmuramoyl-L-alanine amidase [bacterium]
MRNIFTLIFVMLFSISSVFAYDLVLPREKDTIVNSDYIFFVGKAKKYEIITINDARIYIAPNGAFAHSVKLKIGENRILVKSDYNSKIYKFYRNRPIKNKDCELVELKPAIYKVLNDNTPLRSTPIDFGMNRIAHLFKDTNLLINGKKGDFYRVYLSKNKIGWISAESVYKTINKEISPQFTDMNTVNFKNGSVHTLKYTDKLPYVIEDDSNEIIFRVFNPFIKDEQVHSINIKKPDKYSYKTELNGGEYKFKVSKFDIYDKSDFENLTVYIDAGHGGAENGAIGCLGDKEKDINLKIAMCLKKILSDIGINTVMTRECDATVPLEDRVKSAQDNNAKIFVSIHLNSIPDIKMNIHKNRGTSVYYYNPNSKELAEDVLKEVTKTLNTRNDGLKTASFAVIRPTDYIGILVETAYMTNPLDSMIYKSKDFAQKTATGIANGILEFIGCEKCSK